MLQVKILLIIVLFLQAWYNQVWWISNLISGLLNFVESIIKYITKCI